jgi:FlgD Ig-like domain
VSSSRLPLAAFAALVVATVAAFFVTQHLKVSTPLIAGAPKPSPAAIDPLSGSACGTVSHRGTLISFYLLHRADDVAVYVVDQSGAIVRTVASGRHMRRGVRTPDGVFYWNGRRDDGSVAADGTYYFRIALLHQGRTIELTSKPVVVQTVPPHPVVTSVSPPLIPVRDTPVKIEYRGNERRSGTVRIYRTDLPGRPDLVKSFVTPWKGETATWDGKIHQRPAPAGTYLVGLDVTDKACNTGKFPPVIPPPPGSTPHAGVTVRYLAAQPPLDPVPAGSRALVYVDSRQHPFRWTLRRVGARALGAHGAGHSPALHVPVAPKRAGLYELSLRSGAHRTSVPLVVSAARRARILVVLPALTWQGQNPVDDDGDGMPNTLDAGVPIALARPLAHGLPAGFSDEAALLAYLDKSRLPYDLTTDLGLISGTGPALAGHAGVVLAGSERWLPASLSTALRTYVQAGGHALSLGVGSLLRSVTIQGGTALDPTAAAHADVLGAHPGALVARSHDLVTVIRDGLGIFSGTSGAFPGFRSFQPITAVASPGQILSEAGTSDKAPSLVGYELGKGLVVDIGLVGFGSRLAGSVDAQELVNRLWRVLSG